MDWMSIHGINPHRGEVWWVRLDPTLGSEISKTRPCLVVSSDVLNQTRRTVVVVPVSSGPKPVKHMAIEVNCGRVSGVAVIDQVRAAAKERFGDRVGRLTSAEMAEVEEGLRWALGLRKPGLAPAG
jgi:mRNA interferase MazF